MLIVIEGVDASGKETQSRLLHNKFPGSMKISFPDYESNSSALVKMYLSGEFGAKPEDVSPYVASVFFAGDRYASYKTKWEDFLKNDGIVIADRYVSSNLIHQASKIKDPDEQNAFIKWLDEFEYNIMGIPRADFTIFLDMPPKSAQILIKERNNKITGKEKKDIHESDSEYLMHSYNTAVSIAGRMNWHRIVCANGNNIKTPEQISDEIYSAVLEFMKG